MTDTPPAANDDARPPVTPGNSDVPVVVVTGASRGIGYATARAFGARGAQVVAVARTVGGLEELDDAIVKAGGRCATLVPLDLREGDALDRLGLALFERFGRVDVLVGNAGSIGAITPVHHLKPKVFDEVMAVNVTANYRLIRSMDPLLRRSAAGRALFLTCAAPRADKPFHGAHAASKAALEALVRTYAAEVANTPIRCNLFDPGPVRTALRARAVPGENPHAVPLPDSVVEPILELTSAGVTDTGTLFGLSGGTLSKVQAGA